MSNGERKKYFGKYRGTVLNNVDPMQEGRIQVQVPDVSGLSPSSWALPCLPAAGIQNGLFTVPPIGALVWVEFEQGDPEAPIWTGGFWGSGGEVPSTARTVPPVLSGITLQTTLGHGLVVGDAPGPQGGIMIRTPAGATLIVNDTGIYIQNGRGASLVMTGPTVTINNGALVVT